MILPPDWQTPQDLLERWIDRKPEARSSDYPHEGTHPTLLDPLPDGVDRLGICAARLASDYSRFNWDSALSSMEYCSLQHSSYELVELNLPAAVVQTARKQLCERLRNT